MNMKSANADSPCMTTEDIAFLDEAARFFTDPGLIAKSLAWAGKPVESFQNRIPEKGREVLSAITERAIKKAINAAVRTIPRDKEVIDREKESLDSSRLHRGLTTLTGAAGGIFGMASLAVELPITTVLILRAISDQARLYGHDLNDIEIRLECLMYSQWEYRRQTRFSISMKNRSLAIS